MAYSPSERGNARQTWNYVCLVGVAVLTIMAFALFVHTAVGAFYAPEQPGPTPPGINLSAIMATSTSSQGIIPSRMSIPSLNIDSVNVQRTVISDVGNIGVPTNFTDVAWYEYGPKPGDAGPALIDGHVNNGLGLAGVFTNLNSIQEGADIFISDTSGKTLHFVVIGTSTLAYDDRLNDLTEDLATINGYDASQPQLVLMTCEGIWVASHKTYNERIVVLAKLVSN